MEIKEVVSYFFSRIRRNGFKGKFGYELLLLQVYSLLGSVLGYLVRILFSRSLSIREYGLFYALFSFVFFFAPFRDLGLTEASIYFVNKYKAKNDLSRIKGTLIITNLPQILFGIIIALILYVFRNQALTYVFHDTSIIPAYVVFLVLFVFQTLLPSISAVLNAYQHLALGKLNGFFNHFFTIIFSLLLFYLISKPNLFNATISFSLGRFVSVLILATILYRLHKEIFSVKSKITKEMVREIFSYALPIMFSTAAGIILGYTDTIMLSIMASPEMVALYNIARPTLNVIIFLVSPLLSVIFPKVSHWYHHNQHKNIKTLLKLFYDHFLIFSLPLALIFVAFPDLAIKTLFGSQYVSAKNTLRVLALSFVFYVMRYANFAVIAGIGKAKERSIILYIGATLNAILNYFFIKKFYATGAAIATSISLIVMAILSFRLIRKFYKFEIDLWLNIRVVIASLIFFLLTLLFRKLFNFSPLIEAFVVVLISGVLYVLILFLFRVLTKEKIIRAIKLLF